jgi:hypothetical protein
MRSTRGSVIETALTLICSGLMLAAYVQAFRGIF